MECPGCARQNREGARFCDGCGAPLVRICSACGVEARPSARFCDGCGQPLERRAPGPPTAPAPSTDRSPADADPRSLGDGRYVVQRLLGEGSKKRVYLARDSRLSREVAVGLIKTEGLDEAGLSRVRREVEAMGRLGDHPTIVTIYDTGEEHGQPYIVSQYLAGGDLESLLNRTEGRRLPLDRVHRLAEELCQALEHAHRRGVIHRDLKPANVWLTEDGSARLGDFGLAVALDRSRLSVAGTMIGTVSYMPPEQALGRAPDPRSDLYALGAVLYELVTGRPPFLGDDAVAIISQHINTAPVAPSWHNPEVPRPLETVILRLLAKAPEQRPESAEAVRQALESIATIMVAPAPSTAGAEPESNPLDQLAGGVFVGREHELVQLRGALDDALSGHGRLRFLVGEPGIGKTRTAEELSTYARLRGARVLWGGCYEGEGAPVYWPWIQAVRAYVHDRDPNALLAEMGSGASDVAQIVSELRERLPGLPALPPLEPQQARFRLFESITSFLTSAARAQPLVLVLDNLHWADEPSLLLLQFLARELRTARLLVLGTYRDVELGRQHPLARTLAELAREQLGERIVLRGIGEPDIARFIEMTIGRPPPGRLAAEVYRETEGNLFFVAEIVRLLASEGRLDDADQADMSLTIPQSVREVIGRRLDRLSDLCNQTLTLCSVIGREFGLEVVRRIGAAQSPPVTEDALLDALDEAVAARVLAEVPSAVGRYTFSHALIRQTLYDELTTTRRVRLHRRIGEVLEAQYGANIEPHLAELAYHFCQAAPGGDVAKAIHYSVRAGERADRLLAYEEAVLHYERALQALDGQESADLARRWELLLALGNARRRAGVGFEAMAALRQAIEIANQLGATEKVVQAALAYEDARWEAGAPLDTLVVRTLEPVLQAPGDEADIPRSRLLTVKARAVATGAFPSDDPVGQSASLSQEAIALARRAGDPVNLAIVLHGRLEAVWDVEHAEERLDVATELLRLAEAAGRGELGSRGHYHRLNTLLSLGEIDAVAPEIEAHGRVTARLRQPWQLSFTAMFRVMRALLDGRFVEAEGLAEQVLTTGRRMGSRNVLRQVGLQLFALRREQGRLSEQEADLRAIDEWRNSGPTARTMLAVLALEHGREAEARDEFEQLAADDFAVLSASTLWISPAALLAEVCAALHDTRRAAVLYERLWCAETLHVTFGPVLYYGPVARYLGLLAACMSRWDQAEAHFEAALASATRIGACPWVAHVQHDLAAMLVARGRPEDRQRIQVLLTAALETARELGMTRLLERDLATRLRAQGAESSDPGSSIDAVAAAVQQEQPPLSSHAAPGGALTIAFSDIEGFTAMTERLGERRTHEILRAHNAIIRDRVAGHGGLIIKSVGDGFMFAFPDAGRGLRSAIAIQRALADHGRHDPEAAIRVRIGLHSGQVIEEPDDLHGRNVILAARIADQASGGEIVVSSSLKELVDGDADLRFGEPREVMLKGLVGSHLLHPVRWR